MMSVVCLNYGRKSHIDLITAQKQCIVVNAPRSCYTINPNSNGVWFLC